MNEIVMHYAQPFQATAVMTGKHVWNKKV